VNGVAELPRQRTAIERRAYVDGLRAGLKMARERLDVHLEGDSRSALDAAFAEAKSIVDLVDESVS
jgi:hypothetical protein